MVDQAVAFLKRYEDSTLAVRGMRLLSSLLEGVAKQQPSKHHARHDEENKAGPHEGNPYAWPLEDRQSIDAMWAYRQSNSAGDGSQSVVSPPISLQQEPQLRTMPATSIARNAGGLNVLTQDADDLNFVNGNCSFDVSATMVVYQTRRGGQISSQTISLRRVASRIPSSSKI